MGIRRASQLVVQEEPGNIGLHNASRNMMSGLPLHRYTPHLKRGSKEGFMAECSRWWLMFRMVVNVQNGG